MTKLKSNWKKWGGILAWLIASFLLYLCFRDIEWERAWFELKQARPAWLMMAIIFNLSIFVFWACQWIVFLPRNYKVHFSRMIQVNALMSMATNSVPFLGGHALGVILLSKREKVGSAVALSILALDQLAEGLAKISVLLLIALFTPIPLWLKQGIIVLVSGVVLLLCILLVMAHRHSTLASHSPEEPHGRLESIKQFIIRWAHHLEAMRDAKKFFTGYVLALAMKAGEGLAIWAVQKSLGLDLPAGHVLLVLATVNLATMIPMAPGNLGVYEAAVFFVYQFLGVSAEVALGLALFQHLLFLLPMAGTGYILLFFQNMFQVQTQEAS